MNDDKNTQLDPLENLKKELIKLYENTDDTILSVGYGCKSTGGVYTEEKCITFGVVKKLPENEISSEKIIPKTITVDGVVYKTDVYETEIAKLAYNMLYSTTDITCVAYKLIIDDDNPDVTDIHIRELRGVCGNRKALFYNPNDPNNNEYYTYIPNGAIFCFDSDAPQNFPSQFSGYATDNIPYHFEKKSPEPSNCIVTYCCNECCQGCDGVVLGSTDEVIPESINHKNVVRPLKGGISIIEYENENYSNVIRPKDSYGTLGGIVIDSRDGKMVGITNAHVAGRAGFRKNPGFVYKNEWIEDLFLHVSDQVFNDGNLINKKIGAYYDAYKQNDVVQPSFYDGGYNSDSGIPADTYVSLNGIGTTKRIYPLKYNDFNEIDCALINLNNSIVSTDSWKQLGLDALTTPAPFATTIEIDSITINTPVMFSGRTSGIRGVGIYNKAEQNNINNYYSYVPIFTISNINEPIVKYVYVKNESGPTECFLSVVNTSTVVQVESGTNYIYKYKNIIEYRSKHPYLTTGTIGGDSGSLLYAFINNQWKIIGLVFASRGVHGSACRIDRVAELMNTEPYLGTTVNATPNTPIDRALPYELYKSQRSTTISGKKYWLVGRTQLFPTDDAFELKPE